MGAETTHIFVFLLARVGREQGGSQRAPERAYVCCGTIAATRAAAWPCARVRASCHSKLVYLHCFPALQARKALQVHCLEVCFQLEQQLLTLNGGHHSVACLPPGPHPIT